MRQEEKDDLAGRIRTINLDINEAFTAYRNELMPEAALHFGAGMAYLDRLLSDIEKVEAEIDLPAAELKETNERVTLSMTAEEFERFIRFSREETVREEAVSAAGCAAAPKEPESADGGAMKEMANVFLPDEGSQGETVPKARIKVENLPYAGEPTREARIDDEELAHPRRKRGRPAKKPEMKQLEG